MFYTVWQAVWHQNMQCMWQLNNIHKINFPNIHIYVNLSLAFPISSLQRAVFLCLHSDNLFAWLWTHEPDIWLLNISNYIPCVTLYGGTFDTCFCCHIVILALSPPVMCSVGFSLAGLRLQASSSTFVRKPCYKLGGKRGRLASEGGGPLWPQQVGLGPKSRQLWGAEASTQSQLVPEGKGWLPKRTCS